MVFDFALVWFIRNRPMLQQSRFIRMVGHIFTAFGMRYFLLKMDGNILEIVMFAVNSIRTIRSGQDTRVGNLGAVASAIFIGFYIFYGWLLWRSCRDMIRAYTSSQYLTNNPEAKEMQEAFDLKTLSPRYMEFVFDGYKYPINPKLLWTPMIIFCRSFLMGLFIVIFVQSPEWQLPLVLLVEGSFYIFLLRAKFRGSKIEYFAETSITLMRVLFVLAAMLSFTSMADEDPNGPVGIMMGIILITNAAIALFAILGTLLVDLYEKICELPCFHKEEKEEMTRTKIFTKNMKDIAIAVSKLRDKVEKNKIEKAETGEEPELPENEMQVEDDENHGFGSNRAGRFNFKEALIVENLDMVDNSEESISCSPPMIPAMDSVPPKEQPSMNEEKTIAVDDGSANMDENFSCNYTEYKSDHKNAVHKSRLDAIYRDSYYEESKVTPRFHGLPGIQNKK